MIEKKKISNTQEAMKECIWYNDGIRINNNTVYYTHWHKRGIKYIVDLVDESRSLYSWQRINEKYPNMTNFIEFHGIIQSVKMYLKSLTINTPYIFNLVKPFRPTPISWILKSNKGCRVSYNILNVINTDKTRTMIKWERNLDTEIELSEWQKLNIIPFKCIYETKLRWFQYRINQRILSTNTFLHKINISDSDKCSFCHQEPETLVHLFYD